MFISSILLSLCLSQAGAATVTTVEVGDNGLGLPGGDYFVVRTTTSGSVHGVTAEVQSDAGSEDVTLTESDTSLHGSAAIPDLPGVDSRITLTLYDTASASLMSFSGTLGADGSVSVTADEPDCEEGGRVSCTALTNPDIEVLAAEVFVGAAGGYDVTFDLHGADAYDVAYADIVVTESTEVTTCEKGGAGMNALATDEDPLTAVALGTRKYPAEDSYTGRGSSWDEPMEVPFISVVSEGWSSSTVPVSAQVELTGGKTITIPVNSYQVVADTVYVVTNPDRIDSFRVVVNGGTLSVNGSSTLSLDDLASPLCADGVCAKLAENDDGDLELAVSAYATTATALPTEADVKLTFLDAEGTEGEAEYIYPHFQDDVKAVFANDVKFSADPAGVDVSGKVSLLGAPDKKGKQKTLAKGKFYGTFSRDTDGDLGLSGADKDLVSSSGSLLTAGSSTALSDADKDGYVDGPPVALARPASGGPTTTEKHGDILIDGVKIDYD